MTTALNKGGLRGGAGKEMINKKRPIKKWAVPTLKKLKKFDRSRL
jgi:hypothetical protein